MSPSAAASRAAAAVADAWAPPVGAADPRDFRRALGCYATGVGVVTTLDETGRPLGLTVNSFTSVSMAPPLVSWNLQSGSPSLAAFRAAPYFAVSVLAADQQDLCGRFATPAEDKFSGLDLDIGLGGVPLLVGAVARFECRRTAALPGGDHVIFLGEVERYRWSERDPLLFCKGALRFLPQPTEV